MFIVIFAFSPAILVGAGLAAGGALYGQHSANGLGSSQRQSVLLGSAIAPFLGMALILFLVAAEGHVSLESFGYICGIWLVHTIMVSFAAAGGSMSMFIANQPSWAAGGAFVSCLMMGLVSWVPLVLLTAF